MAVNFTAAAARVRVKTGARDTRNELKRAAVHWRATHKEQRENALKGMGVVIPLSDWLGHNNGPPILESTIYAEWCWRRAQEAAFRPPDHATGVRWAKKAAKLGLSYREYRLELLERGRHPTDEDARRIRDARPITAAATRA